jgi:hypothetical protein
MKRILMALLVALTLPGCATIAERTAPEIAKLIDRYCDAEDQRARAVLRDAINAELAKEGHKAKIECHGDTAPTVE